MNLKLPRTSPQPSVSRDFRVELDGFSFARHGGARRWRHLAAEESQHFALFFSPAALTRVTQVCDGGGSGGGSSGGGGGGR